MEASAILKMVEDALYNKFIIIDVIVRFNDRKIKFVIKHPSKCAQGQVLKSSKGKLDEEITDPPFLADHSHRVKVVAKQIFFIVNKSRAQRCGCTKEDDLQLNKYRGC